MASKWKSPLESDIFASKKGHLMRLDLAHLETILPVMTLMSNGVSHLELQANKLISKQGLNCFSPGALPPFFFVHLSLPFSSKSCVHLSRKPEQQEVSSLWWHCIQGYPMQAHMERRQRLGGAIEYMRTNDPFERNSLQKQLP